MSYTKDWIVLFFFIFSFFMSTGTIKFFNTEKWFGFIVPDDGSKDVFVHITVFPQGFNPVEGQRVSYDIQETSKGLNAVNVSLLDEAA